VNEVQIAAELAVAVSVAVAFLRYWRQLVALIVGVIVVLSVIGLMTVISWIDAVPRP
jgi:uncharacterized membrane protein YhhN